MKPLTFPLVVGVALAVVGCIPSLQPLYTEKTTTFEPALIGVWQQDNAESTWAFTRKETNAYSLTYTDKQGRPGQFEARLVKLGDNYFLDLFPEDPQQVENAYYKFHLLRVHTFLKMSLDGSELQLAGMDPTWLKRHLDADPATVRHTTVNNMIVLTASPEELQKFVRRHADDKDVFTAVIHLTRNDAAWVASAE
jgi:hypothetical protein